MNAALELINALDGTRVLRHSSIYSSLPWGDEDQPDFLNAVAELQTRSQPRELLTALKKIERSLGRTPSERRWGPRVIDLDLLLAGKTVMLSDELTLPHPRMHERAFVLLPLAELEPELDIPGKGRVQRLSSKLDIEGVKRLEALELCE